MARLAAAFGSSHSIMLTTRLEDWMENFRRRDRSLEYFDPEGNRITYEEALARAPANAAALIAPAALSERWQSAHQAIARLRSEILESHLDALIIIGDDQRELFNEANTPAIAIYYGETIRNEPAETVPEGDWFARGRMGYREEKSDVHYPCDAALARHLIAGLVAKGFDIAALNALGEGQSEGHAYAFIHRRYIGGSSIPVVPVFINTYYPPNQPTPRRCIDLGFAIADLVASFPADRRIGILGSGGLSHFLINEALDRSIIEALRRADTEFLARIDPRLLQSGSSEIRNWIVIAGAARNLDLASVTYIPGYRSPALTGTGFCFARWR